MQSQYVREEWCALIHHLLSSNVLEPDTAGFPVQPHVCALQQLRAVRCGPAKSGTAFGVSRSDAPEKLEQL